MENYTYTYNRKLRELPPHRKTWINLTNIILSQKDTV